MRINSSGHLLIGKTADDNTTAGTVIHDNGFMSIARSSNIAMILDRHDTDGEILRFTKAGTSVGSIASVGGLIQFGQGNANLKFSNASDVITPANGSGSNNDNALDLGSSSARFKDLYLSGGVYLGGTGSANKLDDYEEGTWTPVYSALGGGSIGTSTVTSGYYVKVGKMVQISFQIASGSLSSPSGEIQITGLPFTASSQTDNRAGFGIGFVMRFGADMPNFCLGILDNVSYIRLHKNATNSSGSSLVQGSDLSGGSNQNYIYASATYQTS